MKEITYKKSRALGLRVLVQNAKGWTTVLREAPMVIKRKSHGKKYPQFFGETTEEAYQAMVTWLKKNKLTPNY